jgi:N-acetylneuraminic acid mutarotase
MSTTILDELAGGVEGARSSAWTKVWTELAGGGMSRERRSSVSAVHKDKLYVVGGENWPNWAERETLHSVEVYDFATQQWSLLPTEMATARRSHGAVVCKDKLYVVGGYDAELTVLGSVEVYDFATETWSILPAPMPQARADISNKVVQHKGKVYVVGGNSEGHVDDPTAGEGWLQSVAVYDIAAKEWSVLPAEMMVNRQQGYAAAVHGNQIYVLGGRGEGRSVEVYDIAVGEWSMMPGGMNLARNSFAAAVHGDNLHAVGGLDVHAQSTMEVLALPSPLPWTPTRHSTFPNSFKRTVYTLMCCVARTNALPDDMLFKIVWLLLRSAFRASHLARPTTTTVTDASIGVA